MILGVDWMWIHDPVTFSHRQGMVTIFKYGKKIVLKGAYENSKVNFLGHKGLKNFIKKALHGLMDRLFTVNTEIGTQGLHPTMEELLGEFSDVF